MLYWAGLKPTTSVVIGIDCKGSCKSNYHMITPITAPNHMLDLWETEQVITLFKFIGFFFLLLFQICTKLKLPRANVLIFFLLDLRQTEKKNNRAQMNLFFIFMENWKRISQTCLFAYSKCQSISFIIRSIHLYDKHTSSKGR